jgi:hypothetical protein
MLTAMCAVENLDGARHDLWSDWRLVLNRRRVRRERRVRLGSDVG